MDKTPAEWLPNAPVTITVVYEHDDYDTMAERVKVARDWARRGDEYVLRMLDAAPGSRIIAAFAGSHYSELGSAVPQ